jgi:hypothetical protein
MKILRGAGISRAEPLHIEVSPRATTQTPTARSAGTTGGRSIRGVSGRDAALRELLRAPGPQRCRPGRKPGQVGQDGQPRLGPADQALGVPRGLQEREASHPRPARLQDVPPQHLAAVEFSLAQGIRLGSLPAGVHRGRSGRTGMLGRAGPEQDARHDGAGAGVPRRGARGVEATALLLAA